jgi:hypothetical protein
MPEVYYMNVMATAALICSVEACDLACTVPKITYPYEFVVSEQDIEVNIAASQIMHMYQMRLSDQERERIYNECQFAIKKMYRFMDKADREAQKIACIDVREATVSAVEGAICGLGGRTPYSVVIGGCLGALARIGGDSFRHFIACADYVEQAEMYAMIADDLQERLWRDE